MMRWLIPAVLIASVLTACGSASTKVPETPTISAARSCLHRHRFVASVVPVAKLQPIVDGYADVQAPIAELRVIRRAPDRTRLFVAYFRSPAVAMAAETSVDPNVPTFRGARALQIQQAGSGMSHGRVLVIEFNPVASNQNTMFVARYCATGVPVPTPANP